MDVMYAIVSALVTLWVFYMAVNDLDMAIGSGRGY